MLHFFSLSTGGRDSIRTSLLLRKARVTAGRQRESPPRLNYEHKVALGHKRTGHKKWKRRGKNYN